MIKSLTGRPVGRPREFDEEAVLEAAMDAFWRKGYEALSLVDLCQCTCLNKASLYRVFGDKHQLLTGLKETVPFKTITRLHSDPSCKGYRPL